MVPIENVSEFGFRIALVLSIRIVLLSGRSRTTLVLQ